MNRDKAVTIVEEHLKEERFNHTIRVAETAVKLAEMYNESKEKAELAAILHDYAKHRSKQELERVILDTNLPGDMLLYHHGLWHGPAGAVLLQREHGLDDEDILQAIATHTTGRANMTKLEMIIFLSDYIEPGRSFPGLDEVREMANKDLIYACWMATKNTISHLMEKQAFIYPDTFHAYNYFTTNLKMEVIN